MFWKPPPRRSPPKQQSNHISFSRYGKKLEDFGDPKRTEAISKMPETPNPQGQWQDPFENGRSKAKKLSQQQQRAPEKQLTIKKAKFMREAGQNDKIFLKENIEREVDEICIIRKPFKSSANLQPELYIDRQMATIESNGLGKSWQGIRGKNREALMTEARVDFKIKYHDFNKTSREQTSQKVIGSGDSSSYYRKRVNTGDTNQIRF
jgi:hypothetical protein